MIKLTRKHAGSDLGSFSGLTVFFMILSMIFSMKIWIFFMKILMSFEKILFFCMYLQDFLMKNLNDCL